MKPTVALSAVSLTLGLLFNVLFFDKVPGISVLIYVVAIAAGLLGLAQYLKRPVSRPALWLLVPLGFFAAMVAVRASDLLRALNILACVLLLLLIARISFHDDLRRFSLRDYVKIPFVPLKFAAPLAQTLARLTALRAVKNHPLATQITRGILLAVPVLVVFMVLFASADLVFGRYFAQVFTIKVDEIAVWRAVLVGLVTCAFIGAYGYIFGQPVAAHLSPEPAQSRFRLGGVESAILLGSVNLLFFAFILIQLAYLFGGLSNISGQGFTYAEYARKGFFELLMVAVVAFGMLWAADKSGIRSHLGHGLAFRVLSCTLIAQVVLIMASAFKRLYLYEQAFGFTTLRLYSHVFVIFLAIIFGLLVVKILKNQAENQFALPAFITVIMSLAGMNMLNPDAFIARQNIDRLYQTGKIDSEYMSTLSQDAKPVIAAAIVLAKGSDREHLERSLGTYSAPTAWQSWNLARRK